MASIECKQSYFEGRDVEPALVDLYADRLGDPDLVLDVGCGRGSFGTLRKDRDVEVVGVDVDIGALETASQREDVLVCDLESGELPFANGSFDGLIAKDILEHLTEPAAVLSEIERVLSPNGRGVISVPMAKPKVVWGDYTHVRGFTEGAIRMMVEDQGLAVVSVSPMGGVPGAGRFGLTKYLPHLLRVPGFRRLASSHEVVLEKPANE